jgi:hypothetical protein
MSPGVQLFGLLWKSFDFSALGGQFLSHYSSPLVLASAVVSVRESTRVIRAGSDLV